MSSLQQLGMIRAVLRGRLNDPDGTKFMDPELNANINLIQQDVVMRLLAINKKWLAKTRIITGTFAPGAYATVPLPDDVLEILDYMTAGGVPITIIPP